MSPIQEAIATELRTPLLLSLDDLPAVVRRFIPACRVERSPGRNPQGSRATLHCCVRRNGVSHLRVLAPKRAEEPSKSFKVHEPGYSHVDVKYLPQTPDVNRRRYLYAAVDRATPWGYIEMLPDKKAATAKGFLDRRASACPFRVRVLLSDLPGRQTGNRKEFTHCFCRTGTRRPTGSHSFDRACKTLGVGRPLIKPYTPRTNGMVERFNGRFADVVKAARFASSVELEKTLLTCADACNNFMPQKALGGKAPLDALHQWYEKAPECFLEPPPNLPSPDAV